MEEKLENNTSYVTSQPEGLAGERRQEGLIEARREGIFLEIKGQLIELPAQVTIYKIIGEDKGAITCPAHWLYDSVNSNPKYVSVSSIPLEK